MFEEWSWFSASLEPKRLAFLRELIPQAGVFAVLANPTFADMKTQVRELEAVARAIGQQLVILEASREADIDTAFTNMIEKRIGALLVAADP